jgi:hypothetical protein
VSPSNCVRRDHGAFWRAQEIVSSEAVAMLWTSGVSRA